MVIFFFFFNHRKHRQGGRETGGALGKGQDLRREEEGGEERRRRQRSDGRREELRTEALALLIFTFSQFLLFSTIDCKWTELGHSRISFYIKLFFFASWSHVLMELRSCQYNILSSFRHCSPRPQPPNHHHRAMPSSHQQFKVTFEKLLKKREACDMDYSHIGFFSFLFFSSKAKCRKRKSLTDL